MRDCHVTPAVTSGVTLWIAAGFDPGPPGTSGNRDQRRGREICHGSLSITGKRIARIYCLSIHALSNSGIVLGFLSV